MGKLEKGLTLEEYARLHPKAQEEPETENISQTPETTALPSISPTVVPESPMPAETYQPEEDKDTLQPLTYLDNPDL